jgi:hypothetical protein
VSNTFAIFDTFEGVSGAKRKRVRDGTLINGIFNGGSEETF